MTAPIGLRAIGVGETVVGREGPGGRGGARTRELAGVGGEGDDGSPDVPGRRGDGEVTVLRDPVSPGGLGDTEVLEHRFRPQEPRGEGDDGDRVRSEIFGLPPASRLTAVRSWSASLSRKKLGLLRRCSADSCAPRAGG